MRPRNAPGRRADAGGFTLAELAIALTILALIAGSLLLPLGARIELQRESDTRALLADALLALEGYAASHPAADGKPHLPCPDKSGEAGAGIANDGQEDREGHSCVAGEGNFPWATLGLGSEDAWSNRLRYAVTPVFADAAQGFTLDDRGSLRICSQAGCSSSLALAQVAVVVSHGGNGHGARTAAGALRPPPTLADETENADGDGDFVSRLPGGDAAGYDDLVAWISPNLLFSRMIAAGRLP